MQTVSRAAQRAAKLHDSLRVVRQNAALVDELTVWLNDCYVLLTTKDKDSIPDDLTVVDALVKEHAVRIDHAIHCTAAAAFTYCRPDRLQVAHYSGNGNVIVFVCSKVWM